MLFLCIGLELRLIGLTAHDALPDMPFFSPPVYFWVPGFVMFFALLEHVPVFVYITCAFVWHF